MTSSKCTCESELEERWEKGVSLGLSGLPTACRARGDTNSKDLKHDVIMCSMGTWYKGYCSNIARTILVDPPKKVRRVTNL